MPFLSLTPTLSFETTISSIIFGDFSMFYQIFLSRQVKRWSIITWYIRVASGIAERPKTYKLGNIRKVFKPRRMIS